MLSTLELNVTFLFRTICLILAKSHQSFKFLLFTLKNCYAYLITFL